jgi:hypothetical protein
MALSDLFKRFKGEPEVPEEDENEKKLMELFQKRHLMKKMYDKAASELSAKSEEADALQRQAGEMGKRLMALDEMLSDPEKGQSVIVHYQLAALWSECNIQLAIRCQELSSKHESDEKQQQLVEFATAQRAKIQGAEVMVQAAQVPLDQALDRKRQLEIDLASSQRIWHYFKRKRLHLALAENAAALAPLLERKSKAEEELDKLKQTPAPEYPGLSIPAKRNINLHLIALAQYLYQTLMGNSVAQHAQNTHGQLPNATLFGDTRTCLQLVGHIADCTGKLKSDAERQLKLGQRFAWLQEKARYAQATDTLPDREVFVGIEGTVGAGTREVKPFDLDAGKIPVNVVDNDFWGLKDLVLK